MCVLSEWEYVHVSEDTLRGQKRASDGARVTGGCVLEFNLGPLQEQYTLLPTDPSLQFLCFLFFKA